MKELFYNSNHFKLSQFSLAAEARAVFEEAETSPTPTIELESEDLEGDLEEVENGNETADFINELLSSQEYSQLNENILGVNRINDIFKLFKEFADKQVSEDRPYDDAEELANDLIKSDPSLKENILTMIEAVANTGASPSEAIYFGDGAGDLSGIEISHIDINSSEPFLELEAGNNGHSLQLMLSRYDDPKILRVSIAITKTAQEINSNDKRVDIFSVYYREAQSYIHTQTRLKAHPDKILDLSLIPDESGIIEEINFPHESDVDGLKNSEEAMAAFAIFKGMALADIQGADIAEAWDNALLVSAEREADDKKDPPLETRDQKPQRAAPKPKTTPKKTPSKPQVIPVAAASAEPTVQADTTKEDPKKADSPDLETEANQKDEEIKEQIQDLVDEIQVEAAKEEKGEYEVKKAEKRKVSKLESKARTLAILIGSIAENVKEWYITHKIGETKLSSRLTTGIPLSYEEKQKYAYARYGFHTEITPQQLNYFKEKVSVDSFLSEDPSQFFKLPPGVSAAEFLRNPDKYPWRENLDRDKLYKHFKGLRAASNKAIETYPRDHTLEEFWLSMLIMDKSKLGRPSSPGQNVMTYLDSMLKQDPFVGLEGDQLKAKREAYERTYGEQPFYPLVDFANYEGFQGQSSQKESAEKVSTRVLTLNTFKPSQEIRLTPDSAAMLMGLNATEFWNLRNQDISDLVEPGSTHILFFANAQKISQDFYNRVHDSENPLNLPDDWQSLNVSKLFAKTNYLDKVSNENQKYNAQDIILSKPAPNSDKIYNDLYRETPIDDLINDIEDMPADSMSTLYKITPNQFLDLAIKETIDYQIPGTDGQMETRQKTLVGEKSGQVIPMIAARYLLLKYMEASGLQGQSMDQFKVKTSQYTTVAEMFNALSNTHYDQIMSPLDQLARASYSKEDVRRHAIDAYGDLARQMIEAQGLELSDQEIAQILNDKGFHYLAAALDRTYNPEISE